MIEANYIDANSIDEDENKPKEKRKARHTSRHLPRQITAEAKRHLIISDIAKNGLSFTDLIKKYMDEWGLGMTTVRNIVQEAISFMRSQETNDDLISMNKLRLDEIYSQAKQEGNYKDAIKAIDTQNKLVGGYTEKVKIDGDSTINFTFDVGGLGDEEDKSDEDNEEQK